MIDALAAATPPPVAADRSGERIVLPGQAPDGQHILAVLLKRSYSIVPGQRCRRTAKDRKLVSGDVHFGDPMNSTVRYESDFVPLKLATDVVLNASAYAPNGRPVEELIASVEIGSVIRSVHVIGDRRAHYRSGGDPVFGDPLPFTVMPIRYEPRSAVWTSARISKSPVLMDAITWGAASPSVMRRRWSRAWSCRTLSCPRTG